MKTAIVHDWLVSFAGAERVLEQILLCYPDADLFSVVDFLDESTRKKHFMGKRATTTFIQKLPFARSKYRNYLSLMPLAIEQLDLSSYDLVISSSHAVAKGVITGPDQLHISYIHSPMRYAWDLQHQYLKESGLDRGVKSWLARRILHKMRIWDLRTVNSVDEFISNSMFIQRRVKKNYRRNSVVIYPPVDTSFFSVREDKEDFYLTASRLVPYKKVDLIVEAFSRLPSKKLIVIGDGPQMAEVKKLASKNITLLGFKDSKVLCDYMQRAKAFVFAAEEDFGIAPVEAQACGTPVIAFKKGGVLETVRGLDNKNPTGVFFDEQTVGSLQNAVLEFESNASKIKPKNCRASAVRFTPELFRDQFEKIVEAKALNFF
ncbi:MAG: glycosyltransferase family 4 protein [Gammaproteobacteria bacterium]